MLDAFVALWVGVVAESLGVGGFLLSGVVDSDRTGSLNWVVGRGVEGARSSRRGRSSERLILAVSSNGMEVEWVHFSKSSPSLWWLVFGVERRAARPSRPPSLACRSSKFFHQLERY